MTNQESTYRLCTRKRYHALDGLPALLKADTVVPFKEIVGTPEIEATYLDLLGRLEKGTSKRQQSLKHPAIENDYHLETL